MEQKNEIATLENYANNLQAKLQMSTVLLKSGLVPAHFKTPEAVMVAILYGQELNLNPMQSLQSILIVQGKPTVDAAGLQALAYSAGAVIEVIEHTDKVCRLKIKRGEAAQEASFDLAEAKQMGLAEKDNWKRMPKDMLYARAVSRGIRRMFPDIIRGFYGKEEMLDSVNPQTQVTVVDAKTGEVLKEVKEKKRFKYYTWAVNELIDPTQKVEIWSKAQAKYGAENDKDNGLILSAKKVPGWDAALVENVDSEQQKAKQDDVPTGWFKPEEKTNNIYTNETEGA